MKKGEVPPMPDGIIKIIVWAIIYYPLRVIPLVVVVGLLIYLVFCFSCSGNFLGYDIGSKPVETKINVNK
jgi:hypothetical protein